MMVSLVPAFTAVGFRQFDPTIFNSIDGSKMDAVSADHSICSLILLASVIG